MSIKTIVAMALMCCGVLMSEYAMSAEMSFKHGQSLIRLEITGEIVRGDAHRFRALIDGMDLRTADSGAVVVTLASPGGDMVEAMKIGRLIRSRFISTTAAGFGTYGQFCFPFPDLEPEQCQCVSACFFIWVAGVTRDKGTLGIHRARFDASYFSGLTAAEAEHEYSRLVDEVKQYLAEMDSPAWVQEKMLSTPSGDIHILTDDELNSIGEPPAIQEWINSKCVALTEAEKQDLVWLRTKKSFQELSRIEERALDDLQATWSDWSKCYRRIIYQEQLTRWDK